MTSIHTPKDSRPKAILDSRCSTKWAVKIARVSESHWSVVLLLGDVSFSLGGVLLGLLVGRVSGLSSYVQSKVNFLARNC